MFASDTKSDEVLKEQAKFVQHVLMPWSFGGNMSSALPKHERLINAMIPLLRNNFANDESAHATWPPALMAQVVTHAASKQPAEGLLVTCTLDYIDAKYDLQNRALQPAEDDNEGEPSQERVSSHSLSVSLTVSEFTELAFQYSRSEKEKLPVREI